MTLEAPARLGIDPVVVIGRVQDAIDAVHIAYPLKFIELDLGTVATGDFTAGFKLTVPILGEIGAGADYAHESTQTLTLALTPRPPSKDLMPLATELTETLRALGHLADDVRLAHPEFDVAPTATLEFVVTKDASVKLVFGVEAKEVVTSKLVVAFDKPTS